MLYAFQLRAHSNARYQVSLLSLSQKELACMLAACGVEADVFTRTLGGTPFLCFEADTLTPAQQAFLAGASGVYMTAALQGDLLKPLDLALPAFLPNDMPEVLKYKGKTNSDFTRMLINLALAAGGRWNTQRPYILDPLCGRGTTLFCALTRGMNAIGIENDRKSVQEGLQYADKWLQYHRLKHATERSSLTLPQGGSVPRTMLRVTGEDQTERQITFLQTDTRNCGSLLKKHPADALVADLPYGVQHAPQANGKTSSFEDLLVQALPAWRQALAPGRAAVLAFNTYTLKRDHLASLAEGAGFQIPDSPLYSDFSHWVEQAVNRDVLVVLVPKY